MVQESWGSVVLCVTKRAFFMITFIDCQKFGSRLWTKYQEDSMEVFDLENFCKEIFLSCFLYLSQNLSASFLKNCHVLHSSLSCHPPCTPEKSIQSLNQEINLCCLQDNFFKEISVSHTTLGFRRSFSEQLKRQFPLLFKLFVKCPRNLVYSNTEERVYPEKVISEHLHPSQSEFKLY